MGTNEVRTGAIFWVTYSPASEGLCLGYRGSRSAIADEARNSECEP